MAFSEEDLRLIMAMCRTSNPQYPDKPMYPVWVLVFGEAELQLRELTAPPEHDEYECMHYDDGCRCMCADCVAL